MLLEALQQAGANPYERIDARKASSKWLRGPLSENLVCRKDPPENTIPRVPLQKKVFGRHSWVEKALVNAIFESYLQGFSTRGIQEIVAHFPILGQNILFSMPLVSGERLDATRLCHAPPPFEHSPSSSICMHSSAQE